MERSGLTVEEFVNRAGGVHIGAVTVGTGVGVVAGGTVNQAVKLGIDTSALRQLLQEVRSAVLEDGDDTAYAEVERSIVAVEGELDESNPDRSRVRDRLVGLRQALERMGPDIAAAGILELIKEAITNL